MTEFVDLVNKRGSVYDIGKKSPYRAEDVADRIKEFSSKLPSAMNSQTTRFVIIEGDTNDRVWDMINEDQEKALGPEMYSQMAPRFDQAKKGLGTVLMFESRDAVDGLPTNPERSHIYKENHHGIAAYAVWLALREMDLGASLQHHNVGFDKGYDREIREYLGLPSDWEMLAQMPFGSIETEAEEKESMDVEDQVIFIG